LLHVETLRHSIVSSGEDFMSHKAKPPASASRTREEILSLVRLGKMTREEAEQWAAKSGEILSQKPSFARFTESLWTLPMVATWIVERSWAGARADGDCRTEYRSWTSDRIDDDEAPPGFYLMTIKPRTLFEVLEESIKHDTPVKPAIELSFALQSGQLRATGLTRNDLARRRISPRSWNGPYSVDARAKRHDAIYAIDDDRNLFLDVLVERHEVLGVWAPLETFPGVGLASSPEQIPESEPAAIYPPGFDAPDWTIEHVLAWIHCPEIESLRRRECLNPKRPPCYGQMYRRGFVDSVAKNALWSSLLTGRLIGVLGQRGLIRTWWRGKSVQDAQAAWFLRDQVKAVWPTPAIQGKGAPASITASHAKHAGANSTKPPKTPKQKSSIPHRLASGLSKKPGAPEEVAKWLRAHHLNRPRRSIKELRSEMTADIATLSDSTIRRAIRLVWPSDSRK
jgi:hypothetical protein